MGGDERVLRGESGEESLAIELSEAALVQALGFRSEEEKPGADGELDFRLYIEGKGCDGFYYGVCRDGHRKGDYCFPQEGSGVRVLVDPETWSYVKGSRIDWVDDERGRGFLVENPRHRAFRGKFFKRKSWQESLRLGREGG